MILYCLVVDKKYIYTQFWLQFCSSLNLETWLRSCYVHHWIRQPSIKCLVRVTFKLSKTTGQSASIFFFTFFYIFNIFIPSSAGKNEKRSAVICFVILDHRSFGFGNEAKDPTFWMTSKQHNSSEHQAIKYLDTDFIVGEFIFS